jgi:hypothetical protein
VPQSIKRSNNWDFYFLSEHSMDCLKSQWECQDKMFFMEDFILSSRIIGTLRFVLVELQVFESVKMWRKIFQIDVCKTHPDDLKFVLMDGSDDRLLWFVSIHHQNKLRIGLTTECKIIIDVAIMSRLQHPARCAIFHLLSISKFRN